MVDFIFVHGWGEDSEIWNGISEAIPESSCHYIDMGFLGKNIENKPKEGIYITHSFGTVWALKNCAPYIKGLISICGFTNFTDFVEPRTVQTMQRRLQRNPAQQMQEFWIRCGFDDGLDGDLNVNRLHEGLEWLMTWDAAAELEELNVPVLALAARNDKIAPFEPMSRAWARYEMDVHENGEHNLPVTDPEWCAQKIKGFIK